MVWPMPGQTLDLNCFPVLGVSVGSPHLLLLKLLLLNATGELAKWRNVGAFFPPKCLNFGI